jgi:sulfur dioxygenase
MIFRQLFDATSGTYTYLLASRRGGEALIVDPVLEKVDRYLTLIRELDLKLVKALDTHLHADHITGLGALRDSTRCITVMGEQSSVDVVSMRLSDGDKLRIEGLELEAIYTPGHTDDSYSFRTMVFPAHDYKGDTVSTIGEEKRCNPRLQVGSVDAYVALMNGLNLSNPKMMDVAVPANKRQGLAQDEIARRGWAVDAVRARAMVGCKDTVLVDLREKIERQKHGAIPGALHAPYSDLEENIQPGGMLFELASATDRRLLFYCAFGERSAMAVRAAHDAGLETACHIHGGIDAWKRADGPLTH